MPKFITNIQLQDADEKDYEKLSRELEKESFKGEAHAAKSKAYITGKGVFSFEGSVTIQKVIDTVLRVAAKIGKKYSFFIIKDKPSGAVFQ